MFQYDIYQVDLNPTKWHVQSGHRPCVIIQGDIFNAHSPTIIVVPLTSVFKNPFPSEFFIEPSATNGLSDTSRFLGSQIITVDKKYLGKKVGKLESEYHPLIEEAIRTVLWF